jgi:hypothetical protein
MADKTARPGRRFTQIGMGTCIAATDVVKAMSVKKERKEGNEVLRVDGVDLVDLVDLVDGVEGEVSGAGGEHFSRTRTIGRRCRLFAEARGAAVD